MDAESALYRQSMIDVLLFSDMQGSNKTIAGPFVNAFGRIDSAVIHLENAKIHYHNPIEFRTHIHSCIQELRNSTLILQKQKAIIPNFTDAYSPWQKWFSKNELFRWLNDARVQIVHKNDLNLNSRGSVYLNNNYLNTAGQNVLDNFDPSISSQQIAHLARAKVRLLTQSPKDGMLRAVREWKSNELPSYEIVEALIKCATSLHISIGQVMSTTCGDKKDKFEESILQCEEIIDPALTIQFILESDRSILINLDSGEEMVFSHHEGSISKSDMNSASERYGDDNIPKSTERTPEGQTEFYMSMAKIIFKKDGMHHPIVMLLHEGNLVRVLGIDMPDNSTKYLAWNNVADQVANDNADAIVFIGESWASTFVPGLPMRPADRIDRTEQLNVHYLDSCDNHVHLYAQIGRISGSPILGPTQQWPESLESCFFLNPIREQWKDKS
jgi:hypothetical protein